MTDTTLRVLFAARQELRARLLARDPESTDGLLRASGLVGPKEQSGLELLSALGELLDVKPDLLRATDTMATLLHVRVDELSVDKEACAKWESSRGTSVQPFAYELMAMLERYSDGAAWKRQWRQLGDRPRNEEEWINLIAGMTLTEFIAFFSATRS